MGDVSSEDDLLEALHQRMVTSGTWERLLRKMQTMLTATSYEDDLAVYASGASLVLAPESLSGVRSHA